MMNASADKREQAGTPAARRKTADEGCGRAESRTRKRLHAAMREQGELLPKRDGTKKEAND